jgi:hypothetical protein
MKKTLYLIAAFFVSILFTGCEAHEVVKTIFATNESSYDVYVFVSVVNSSAYYTLGEIEAGEENKELYAFWEFEGTERLDGYIEFYYKRTEAQNQSEMSRVDSSLFISKIDDANSIVEVIRDFNTSYPSPEVKEYIYYRLIITNAMLGLPPLMGGE